MTANEPIQAQAGFQMQALSCPADILIMGAAAGVGKSWTLQMEAARNVGVPSFTGIIFRRTSPQIRNPGALLDSSKRLMPKVGGTLRDQEMEWRFPTKDTQGRTAEEAVIKFSHLQHEKDVENHQGAEYAFIGFDELTHFTESQFWYMISRNRSTCGVSPYVRASCNPDPDSFVAQLIEWYIDQETGYPIPERVGVLRYLVRINGVIVWGDSKEEVYELVRNDASFLELEAAAADAGVHWRQLIKSFSFISGSIYENKKLLATNPDYLATLMSLEEKEQLQLLRGNWKVSQDGMALAEYMMVQNIFSNYPTPSMFQCITCDVSRFGRDFTVLMVWRGWVCTKLMVWYKTESHEIVQYIEMERQRFGIIRTNVVVDADGPIGAQVVKSGQYRAFHGGALPLPNLDLKQKHETYENLKTQLAYHVAHENINTGNLCFQITFETCFVDGQRGTKVKANNKIQDVRDLIKQDIRAWKRKPRSTEGKMQMNNKDEQKILLNGRSPDFGDNLIMRKWFDLALTNKGVGS